MIPELALFERVLWRALTSPQYSVLTMASTLAEKDLACSQHCLVTLRKGFVRSSLSDLL
jgi:hypothetical protein